MSLSLWRQFNDISGKPELSKSVRILSDDGGTSYKAPYRQVSWGGGGLRSYPQVHN